MEFEMTTTTRAVYQQQAFDPNNNASGSQNATNFSDGKPKRNKITDFFKVSRAHHQKQQQKPANQQDLLYLPVGNVTAQDVMKSGGRVTVQVNDMEVALVAHNDQIYAIEPKCPHVGGPVHLGDIEEIPGCGPCIKCPWHSWRFSLTSGRCIAPQDKDSTHHLQTFPVRLDTSMMGANPIKVGFTQLSPNIFNAVPE